MSSPVALVPRRGSWLALGLLITFTLIGLFRRAPDQLAVALLAVAVTLGAGGLTLRRRGLAVFPPAALASAGIAVLCYAISSNVGWFTLAVLTAWCVLAGGRLIGLVHWAGAMALFGAQWIWADADPGWGAWMAGTTFTLLAALLVRHELELVAKLRAAQAGLAESARTEERNRIARELHDVIAHTLIVSQLHVASARLAVEHDPTDAARSLAEAERLGRESLAEVRRAAGLLRPDEDGGTVAPLPGAADLPALVERFRSAGSDATLTVAGDLGSVPATTGLALYRVVQEALTNAVKHASGWPVTVEVDLDAARAELVVETGAPPGRGTGLGLSSMRERAGSVGGRCEAGPGGRGWQVRAELPTGGTR
ncbi:MAG TPA: histidine kinase [Jatrophihabitantaceae bacterium]